MRPKTAASFLVKRVMDLTELSLSGRRGKMKKNIVLIGMPASGKSTVGVILAKLLGMDFVDTDLLIQKKTGRRLAEIIEQDGLDRFIETEEEVCCLVDVTDSVIATGGSAVYGRKAMEHLKKNGRIVYLEIDYPTMERRLHHVKQRGVVLRPDQSMKELYDERVELYRKYADFIISEEGLDIEETAQKCLEKLKKCLTDTGD